MSTTDATASGSQAAQPAGVDHTSIRDVAPTTETTETTETIETTETTVPATLHTKTAEQTTSQVTPALAPEEVKKPAEATLSDSAGDDSQKNPASPATRGDNGPTTTTQNSSAGVDNSMPKEFGGEIATNNEIPSRELLQKIEEHIVLDRHGKSHTFKSLYSGRNVARRMLVIFVRHFFCGNCQDYLRSLSESIKTEALLGLPVSTFITVIGCGDPGLIQQYADATNCPFSIYTDPTRHLYETLGMTRTWDKGERPAYMRHSLLKSSAMSVISGLKNVPSGLATKSGDYKQVGGEFLFEPESVSSPIEMGRDDVEVALGEAIAKHDEEQEQQQNQGETHDKPDQQGQNGQNGHQQQQQQQRVSFGSHRYDENDDAESQYGTEEKRVTWCHRMRTTRDHAEVPELMELLGLDGNGKPTENLKRWARAIQERKGTGLSMASQMNRMSLSMNSQRRLDLPGV